MLWPPEDIWTDADALRDYYVTHAIPLRPRPGVLIVSIVVSILGSYATLLCLGRRTASKGYRNHALLLLAGLCFSAVAVWGMHFVSMISVRLRATPDVTWYLKFSKGFTAMSLIVPMLATFLAFYITGGVEFHLYRGIIAGILMGLSISLMHYSASFALPYLTVGYEPATVVFAIVIACLAATAALLLFFRLRSQWEDSFWKRSLCAVFLAAAVCGMHYLGLGGTSYKTKSTADTTALASGGGQSTRLTISISVMCGAIIILTVIISLFDFWTKKGTRAKARHVILASAAFDPTGKLLVKADGTLPMQIIQTDADLKKLVVELDPRQGTFQWLYQLAFVWHSITPYIAEILRSVAKRRLGAGADLIDLSIPANSRESFLFRRRFIEAATMLAQSVDISVEALGHLLDRVLTTGTMEPEGPAALAALGQTDDEKAVPAIPIRFHGSEGVMLFLVREISNAAPFDTGEPGQDKAISTDNIDHYLQRGYRMTDTHFFARALADNLGVQKGEMDLFLSACKTYAKRGSKPVVQAGGIYASIFGVRPTLDQQGDMVVYNFARHQIPAYRLPDVCYPMTNTMTNWINEYKNVTMAELIHRANVDISFMETHDSGPGSIQNAEDEALYEFLTSLVVAMDALLTGLRQWSDIADFATFSPEIVKVPTSDDDTTSPSQLIMLNAILPLPNGDLSPIQSRLSGIQIPEIESGRATGDKPPPPFVYSPWTLFAKAQAMVNRDASYYEFAESVRAELQNVYPIEPKDYDSESLHASSTYHEKSSGDNPFTPRQNNDLDVTVVGDDEEVIEQSPTKSMKELPPRVASNGVLQSPAMLTAKKNDRPSTGSSIKKGLSNLLHRQQPKDAHESEESLDNAGPAVYSKVRHKAEGWWIRCMASLKTHEMAGLIGNIDPSGAVPPPGRLRRAER